MKHDGYANSRRKRMSISVQIGVVPVEINAQVYVLQLQTEKSFQNALVVFKMPVVGRSAEHWNTDVHLEKLLTLSNL